jgi:trk system potassium uptake protein TrkH
MDICPDYLRLQYNKTIYVGSPCFVFASISHVLGGNADSTTGGLKTKRIAWLLKQLIWFVGKSWQENFRLSITFNGKKVCQEEIPEKIHKVTTIFLLWVLTLLPGTLLHSLTVEEKYSFQHIFFEVASARNSVGLSTGISSPDLDWTGKIILIVLMWMGRLEIFAVLFRICSPFVLLRQDKQDTSSMNTEKANTEKAADVRVRRFM